MWNLASKNLDNIRFRRAQKALQQTKLKSDEIVVNDKEKFLEY